MLVIWQSLDLCLPDHLMFWAACSLGYFGFLRLSEFTVPSLASFSPSYHLGVQVISVDSPSAPWWGDVPHWLRQILASVNIPGNFSSHGFCIRATTVAARNGVPDHLMHLLLCSWSTALEHWSTAFPPWSSLPFPVCSPFCCFFSSSLLHSHQFPSRAASTSAGSGLPLLSLLVLQCQVDVHLVRCVQFFLALMFRVRCFLINLKLELEAWGPYGEWRFQVTRFSGPSILQAPGEGFP